MLFRSDGLTSLFAKHSKSLPELEQKLTNAFATASTTSKYTKSSTNVSIRLPLGTDTKIMLQLHQYQKLV